MIAFVSVQRLTFNSKSFSMHLLFLSEGLLLVFPAFACFNILGRHEISAHALISFI